MAIKKSSDLIKISLTAFLASSLTAASIVGFNLLPPTSDSSIQVEYVPVNQSTFEQSFLAYEVTKQVFNSVFELHSYLDNAVNSSGSGFVISDDGYLISNAHVITYQATTGRFPFYTTTTKVYERITASYGNQEQEYDLEVVAYDIAKDLAVLKFVDQLEFNPLVLANSDFVTYGEPIVVIGNALGYGLSVTSGIVSAPNRTFSNADGTSTNAIQIDAALNNGNSGGPLFNAKAEVIGVNSFKMVYSNSESMGFAIPSNDVINYIKEVETNNGLSIPFNNQ